MSVPAANAVEAVTAPSSGRLRAFPDIAKIVAIFAVVTVHVTAPASEGFQVLTNSAWLGAVAVETAMRWCVPLFVMVSGMLLLRKSTVRETPAAFYRRRVARVAIPLVVWSLVYRFFLEYYTGPHATWLEHVQALYAGQPYYHLYFLYIIAGLYLVCPFLARAIKGLTQRQLAGMTIGALLLGFLWMGVPPWLPGTGSNAFSQFAPFIGYFLAGRLLGEVRLSGRIAAWCAALFALLLVVSTAVTYAWVNWEGLENGRYLYGYLSPTVIVMSICIFLVIRYLVEGREARRPIRHLKQLHFVGEATFGIFLIHPLFFEFWLRQPPGARPPATPSRGGSPPPSSAWCCWPSSAPSR